MNVSVLFVVLLFVSRTQSSKRAAHKADRSNDARKSVSEGNAEVLRELGVKLQNEGPFEEVSVLSGQKAYLPCNVSTFEPGDKVKLVLWFKNNSTRPVYSYDNRDGSPSHWSNVTVLGERARFQVSQPGLLGHRGHARLEVLGVSPGDVARWRCRVDYNKARTTTTDVELRVIELPDSPHIFLQLPRAELQPRSNHIDSQLSPTGGHGGGGTLLVMQFANGTATHDHKEHGSAGKIKFMEFLDGRKIGPFKVGDSLRLRCLVSGGSPSPNVTWLHNDSILIDETFETSREEGTVTNTLVIRDLRRDHFGSTLTCAASNNVLRDPVQTSVVIDMFLEPSEVKLTQWKDPSSARQHSYARARAGHTPLSAGRPHRFQCEAKGARPNRPTITWWLGKKQLLGAVTSYSHSPDDSSTLSTLTFQPRPDDDMSELSCRGRLRLQGMKMDGSGQAADAGVSDSIRLSVFYPPTAELRLGPTLNSSAIREGADVYFECHVKSRPPPTRIEWRHEGRRLRHEPSGGVIMSNQSLVLQKVHRRQSGAYTCTAFNEEGNSTSNAVHMTIKYKPFCKAGLPSIYGAWTATSVDILCGVQANPNDDVTFEWSFNSSVTDPKATGKGSRTKTRLNQLEHRVIKTRREMENEVFSVLRFRPKSEMELGTVLCWARNSIGKQSTPCVFHLISARRPNPVQNCSVQEKSFTGITIRCQPGFDGGLPQNFTMELLVANNHDLVLNMTSDAGSRKHLIQGNSASSTQMPTFQASGLKPNTGYLVSVFASNEKGRSDRVNFHVFTNENGEGHKTQDLVETAESALITNSSEFQNSLNDFGILTLLFVIGASICVVFVALAAAVLCARRMQRRRRPQQQQQQQQQQQALAQQQNKQEQNRAAAPVCPGSEVHEPLLGIPGASPIISHEKQPSGNSPGDPGPLLQGSTSYSSELGMMHLHLTPQNKRRAAEINYYENPMSTLPRGATAAAPPSHPCAKATDHHRSFVGPSSSVVGAVDARRSNTQDELYTKLSSRESRV